MSSFDCERCDYHTKVKANYERHLKSKKHMRGGGKKEYSCGVCNDYKTTNRGNFYRHKKTHNEDELEPSTHKQSFISQLTTLKGRKKGIIRKLEEKKITKEEYDEKIKEVEKEIKELYESNKKSN